MVADPPATGKLHAVLRITGLFLILFSVLLTMFWPRSYDEAPAVPFVWQYDLRTAEESARPAVLGDTNPFNLVYSRQAPVLPANGNDARSESDADAENEPALEPARRNQENKDGGAGGYLIGPAGPALGLQKGERVFAPFHGNGFFRYAKIGRELSFLARNGEELWRKPYKAYPVSDPGGDLVLLLTGDNNRIDVIDPSGNPFGVRSVSGNFMTDLDFAGRRAAAALVFSTGAVTVLNEEAQAILRYTHESADQPLFVKSCALGPDARVVAIHMLDGDQDRIVVLRLNGDAGTPEDYSVLRRIDLNATYPHLLHFAVSPHGLLLTAPDRTAFYALGSGEDRNYAAPGEVQPNPGSGGDSVSSNASGGTDGVNIGQAAAPTAPAGSGFVSKSIYRPVFADRDYFVFGQGDMAIVLDQNGVPVTRLVVDGSSVFRVMPGPLENQFALHGSRRIEFYEFAFAASR